jgi:hypothetical protein
MKPSNQEYEYIIWRLSRTLWKLNFSVNSPLKANYGIYAYKYGYGIG